MLDCHIFDNPFFVGSPGEKLPVDYSKLALERLQADLKSGRQVTGDIFKDHFCGPLRQLFGSNYMVTNVACVVEPF